MGCWLDCLLDCRLCGNEIVLLMFSSSDSLCQMWLWIFNWLKPTDASKMETLRSTWEHTMKQRTQLPKENSKLLNKLWMRYLFVHFECTECGKELITLGNLETHLWLEHVMLGQKLLTLTQQGVYSHFYLIFFYFSRTSN